jgi:hypothetical protein
MRKFFDNKVAFLAIAFLFAAALAWNLSHGAGMPLGTHLMPPQCTNCDGDNVLITHGPPPPIDCTGCTDTDRSNALIAHGPPPPIDCTGCTDTDRSTVIIAHGPPPVACTGCTIDGSNAVIAHGPPPPIDCNGCTVAARLVTL